MIFLTPIFRQTQEYRDVLFTDRGEAGGNFYAISTHPLQDTIYGATYKGLVVEPIPGQSPSADRSLFRVRPPVERVCIKWMHVSKILNNPSALENPVQEIAALLHVNQPHLATHAGRPHVCGFHDAVQNESYLFTITPFYAGGDCISYLESQRLRTGCGFPETTALRIIAHMCRGVQLIEDVNMVHRDLKLDNTCVTVDPSTGEHTYTLIDMGQAVRLPRHPLSGLLMAVQHCGAYGTPAYMSPETYTNRRELPLDIARAEMWSVGVCLMMLLMGQYPPWKFPCMVDSRFESFFANGGPRGYLGRSTRGAGVSDSTLDLLTRMLTIDPASRISVKQVLAHPAILSVTGDDMDVASDAGEGPTGEIEIECAPSSSSEKIQETT